MIGAHVPLRHLAALTDSRGVFEHAEFDRPRPEHGYCVDDAARALMVAVREEQHSPSSARIAAISFAFVDAAIGDDGTARNRMDAAGRWIDEPAAHDWWGRAIWGLGVAATASAAPALRTGASIAFHRAARTTSTELRAMAFATLGAAAMLDEDPQDADARGLIEHAAELLTRARSAVWEWPEDRLRYANAVIPDALIAAGTALGDSSLVERGLRLLGFLVDIETFQGHLSVTPASGRTLGDTSPAFDQQPIEVAAIAEASARAFAVTGDPVWQHQVRAAWGWFQGDNDRGIEMFDARTGAGYDGLTVTGRNENRGAESTLAALSTLQCVRRWLDPGGPALETARTSARSAAS